MPSVESPEISLPPLATIVALREQVLALQQDNDRLNNWVADLQRGQTVNCVYCGHSYGPNPTTPVSMADALREHVESCPKHPMSAIKKKLQEECGLTSTLKGDLAQTATNFSAMVVENLQLKGALAKAVADFENNHKLLIQSHQQIRALDQWIADLEGNLGLALSSTPNADLRRQIVDLQDTFRAIYRAVHGNDPADDPTVPVVPGYLSQQIKEKIDLLVQQRDALQRQISEAMVVLQSPEHYQE